MGFGYNKLNLTLAARFQSASYNLVNPNLHLKSGAFIPMPSAHPYETLVLKGYIIIFDVKPMVKVILYGNGTNKTFELLKADLLLAFKSCEITE